MQWATVGLTKGHGAGATRTFRINTADEDRDGDVLEPLGAVLDHYLQNPVVLWAHNYSIPPIARTRTLAADRHGLSALVDFAPTPLAQEIQTLVDAGFLKGASVGFTPIEWEPRRGGAGNRYTRWELLEWSLVPVPSNPYALLHKAKRHGLATPALERMVRQQRVIRIQGVASVEELKAIVREAVLAELKKRAFFIR